MEGTLAPVECVDDPLRCPMVVTCPTHATWVELREAVVQVLERTTVRELAERKKAAVAPSPFPV
jgi:DNA-binding IscR family transcriptional regulator